MAVRKPSRLSATDLFCGAGGSSIGAEGAGVSLSMGVNHWARAVETHSANFPYADHDCRDVSDTHPSRYPSTHLLLASPECTNHSQAKGRRRHDARGQLGLEGIEPVPVEAEERSRATAWDVVRMAEHHGYEAIVVETPGAGGYGNPAERDKAALAADLMSGKFTRGFLKSHYGFDPAKEKR